jgi:hypothetical protein
MGAEPKHFAPKKSSGREPVPALDDCKTARSHNLLISLTISKLRQLVGCMLLKNQATAIRKTELAVKCETFESKYFMLDKYHSPSCD